MRTLTHPIRRRTPLATLLASGLLALLLAGSGTDSAAASPQPAPARVDSNLRDLLGGHASGRRLIRRAARSGLRAGPRGRVLLDIYTDGDPSRLAQILTARGMEVAAASAAGPLPVVEGWLPLEEVAPVSGLAGVRALEPVLPPGVDSGSVTSEGDSAHRGPQARSLGATGAGVRVGVISDSLSQVSPFLSGSQGSGDLPPGVTILQEGAGSDEGRAMMEAIYDEAPGVTHFFFSSGTASGAAGKAAGIDDLVAHHVNVIADDTFHLDEPFFQDGQVAQAVDRARRAGVAYLASAGNRGRQSYEATFRPDGASPAMHLFGPGDTTQTIVSVPDGKRITVALQWDEPWGGAATNLDTYLVNTADQSPLASNETNEIATGIPSTGMTWLNTTGVPVTVGLRIKRTAGTRRPLIKYIASGDFGNFSIAEANTASSTVNPDAASAQGAITVGAVAAGDPGTDDPEPYSSRGPVKRLFSVTGRRLARPLVRRKPNIAGADDISTTLPTFSPFAGTSAAAASAAGVAVLTRSANPAMPLAELRAIIVNPANAIDCTPPGNPDAACGSGFILADRAVHQAQDPTPPAVRAIVRPVHPKAGGPVRRERVRWKITDHRSPVAIRKGCGAVVVKRGSRPRKIRCRATSAGGTTARTVRIKRLRP